MLKTRVITALILLFGLLAAVFGLPPAGWLLLCVGICAAAAWEWGNLTRMERWPRAVFAALAAAACGWIGWGNGLAGQGGHAHPGFSALMPFYLISAGFWLVCAPFWLARRWVLRGISASVAVGLILLVPPSLAIAHLRLLDPWLLLGGMSFAWVADIAAYFTGRAFGKRKLAPEISPGKTREGAYGALLAVSLYGLALAWWWIPASRNLVTAIGLLVGLCSLTILSIMGDLFESLLKRQAGLKDSGSLLPGHGGILDRIDSLTSTLPLLGLAALAFGG